MKFDVQTSNTWSAVDLSTILNEYKILTCAEHTTYDRAATTEAISQVITDGATATQSTVPPALSTDFDQRLPPPPTLPPPPPSPPHLQLTVGDLEEFLPRDAIL